MKNYSPYHNFIEHLFDKSFRLEKKELNREESLVQLLIEIVNQKNAKRFELFENEEDIDSYTDYEKALFIEAKVYVLAAYKGQQAAELVPLAEEALALYPEAAISRSVLASWEFQKKRPDEGIRILLEILDIYPGAKWVYLHMVRMLCSTREYKKAIPYIGKLESKTQRFLYFVTIQIIRPAFWLILIGIPLSMIFPPQRAIFLFALEFVFIIIPLIVLLLIAVYKNEKVLTYHYKVWALLLFAAIVFAMVISD